MRKQLVYLLSSIAILGMIGATAEAATIRPALSNPILVDPNSDFTLSFEGAGFGDKAESGGFSIAWTNPNQVIRLTGIKVNGNPWDTRSHSIEPIDSAKMTAVNSSGQVDWVFLGASTAVGPGFSVVDIDFHVIGAPGDTSDVTLQDAFGGWWAPGTINIPVEYLAANVVVTPIPAAVWLMFSALGGLGLATRKKKSAPIIA